MGYNVFQAVTPKKCDTVAEAELISQHGVSCLRPSFLHPMNGWMCTCMCQRPNPVSAVGRRRRPTTRAYHCGIRQECASMRLLKKMWQCRLPPSNPAPSEKHGSLFVHAVVVRAGTSPNPSLTAKALNPRREAARERQASHEMRLDWLHASARLTRHLPPTRAKYTNLLKDATDRNRTEHEEPEFRTLHVPAPLVGQVGIDVQGALAWTGLAFALPSFASPSLALAVPGTRCYFS